MKQLYEYFTPDELACRCGNCDLGQADMSGRFMGKLIVIRRETGIPMPISSAVRCDAHDKAMGGLGAHRALVVFPWKQKEGHAVDVLVSGREAWEIIRASFMLKMELSMGLMQHGPHEKRFIHLDDLPATIGRPRPWVWTYPG